MLQYAVPLTSLPSSTCYNMLFLLPPSPPAHAIACCSSYLPPHQHMLFYTVPITYNMLFQLPPSPLAHARACCSTYLPPSAHAITCCSSYLPPLQKCYNMLFYLPPSPPAHARACCSAWRQTHSKLPMVFWQLWNLYVWLHIEEFRHSSTSRFSKNCIQNAIIAQPYVPSAKYQNLL